MAECIAPQLFRNRETHQYWLAPCGRWACPACARRLAARWRAVLQWASVHGQAPQYLMTLTLREPLPLWREAPTAAQAEQKAAAVRLTRFLTRALTRLVAEIRRVFGPCDYIAFVELTTGRRTAGHRPHLHLLVRGAWVPPQWLSRRWQFHTHGSFRVDNQPVRSPEQAAGYLVGYTVGQEKKEQQVHLPNWPGPRVRYSRTYFPAKVDAIRQELLAAWREAEGQVPADGSWEWLGSLARQWWSRLSVMHAAALRLADSEAAITPGSIGSDWGASQDPPGGRDRGPRESWSRDKPPEVRTGNPVREYETGWDWRQAQLAVCFTAPGESKPAAPAGRVHVSVLPAEQVGELRTQFTDLSVPPRARVIDNNKGGADRDFAAGSPRVCGGRSAQALPRLRHGGQLWRSAGQTGAVRQ